MTFSAGVLVFILTAGAMHVSAENQSTTFRIPDPEEINEALTSGLIEYEEYLELLEISRAGSLSAADSLYLLDFPDLLAGFSAQPLVARADEDIKATEESSIDSQRRQSMLVRYYRRLNTIGDSRRLCRSEGSTIQARWYGEVESGYSGDNRWSRRYIEYERNPNGGEGVRLRLGNFKEAFGMGLIYGYHGRLLSQSSAQSEIERFLYPGYGGGNGAVVSHAGESHLLKLLVDTDRNENFAETFTGGSYFKYFGRRTIGVSVGRGRIRNRDTESDQLMTLISLSVTHAFGSGTTEGEAAVSRYEGRYRVAGAWHGLWRSDKTRLEVTGWSYDGRFPSFFSGGPSSRRSRTLYVDDLDFSYRDRRRGETGITLASSHRLAVRTKISAGVGYAVRAFDDNRVEFQGGLAHTVNKAYRLKIDCYWRADGLYSGNRTERRIQLELVNESAVIRNRLVTGYRFSRYAKRNDYLVLYESRVRDRWGQLVLTCKLDRLRPSGLRTEYIYMTAAHDTKMGSDLYSYIKYSYRYRRGDAASSYGTVRLDVRWTF